MGSALGGVAAIVAIVTSLGLNPWDALGWTTPSQHSEDVAVISEDVAALNAKIEQVQADAVGGVQEFRDEWKCEELEDELVELLKQQRAGDDSVETQREIEKVRARIKKLNCERFDDT